MSEPQHPQPHDTETNAGRPDPAATRATVPPVAPSSFDSLAAVGARLTQLREAKGWSVDDVSARLKVSSTKLRALESGDISHLPDTTFALGVVRSYAKMLGADPMPFTQALRREKGVPEPDLSMPASSGRDLPRGRVSLSLGGGGQKHRSWLWGVAAVIVAVIALGMWHTNGGDSSAWLARLKASANGATGSAGGASGAVAGADGAGSDAAGTEAASATPDEQAAAGTSSSASSSAAPMPAPLPMVGAQPGAPAVSPTTAASAPAAPVVAPKPAVLASAPAAASSAAVAAAALANTATSSGGSSIVAVRVTEDSWLSVRQKDGKELFSGIVHSGDAKEVSGEGPFKVTVGNRAGLDSVTLDGQPVDPSKYSSAKGNVARFALP